MKFLVIIMVSISIILSGLWASVNLQHEHLGLGVAIVYFGSLALQSFVAIYIGVWIELALKLNEWIKRMGP